MYETELRQYLKDNNGPTFDQMTIEIMEIIGVDPVFESPTPVTSSPYEYVSRQGVEQIDNKWYKKYIVQTLDDAGKKIKDDEIANAVRNTRNTLLNQSDWTQLADAPVDKTIWATYRQELRDIPSQTGFPHNVVWPNKP